MSEPKQNPQPAAAPVVIKQSSGKGLAAGALVLALLGLGASGFLFVQGQNVLKNQELAFSQKIDKAALGESENASLLKDNINRQTTIQAELERLNNGQRSNSEQIAVNQKAYQELLKGRVNWLVDEAETMLNIAAQQLLLTGNVQGAAAVLEHINNRLSRFDQPDLLPIKQAVSSDLAALKNRPYVDVSGTALRIDRLETAVAGLPLVTDGMLKPGAAQKVESDATLPWWQNAWDKTLGALKGLVEVRHLDNNDAMLMAPEQAYFVRENLRLRLLDARTALLQLNGEVYQSDLNNVEAAVRQYFDNKSPATQSWLKELAELKALDVRMVSDDALKASLSAVRTYQDGVRTQVDGAGAATDEASAPAAAAVSEPAAASEAAAVMPQAPALPSEQADEAAQPKVQPQAPKADKEKGAAA
ncbi:uroporphyrinogen-III C-methyltransferase [Neisseria perflava]|uniref:uroporphyrinogen-III C-methyltransferase n=1 Tax=Neisseria perflava TaxID=33053 RepID=UPI0020A0FB33|nr:uroporphyrinogen-III C-methyltransferase [Neisseria perflava]